MNVGVILSGGTGTRFGANVPKQYLKVNGKEVSKEQVLEFAIPSKMQPTNQDNKTFILSISNIKSLG